MLLDDNEKENKKRNNRSTKETEISNAEKVSDQSEESTGINGESGDKVETSSAPETPADNNQDKKKSNHKRRGVSMITYILTILVVGVVTIFSTSYYFTGQTPITLIQNPNSNMSTAEVRTLQGTFNTLVSDYIEDVPREDLVNGAIKGMTSAAGDPYTQYLIEQEAANLDETMEGSFQGIGAQVIEADKFIQIVSPIKGSPAEEAGLQANDLITSVDGQSIEGYTASEAVELIRGEAGTDVELGIKRGDQESKVTVTRDNVPIQSVYGEVLAEDPTVGHIQITDFSTPTYQELVDTITSLRDQGAKRFILDVRGNPGGLLTSVLQIANMFLNDGDIIMQTQAKGEDPVKYAASDEEYGDFQVDEPVTVLVDGGSASASEILAGALQQSANAPVVGTNSFGKGTVQTIIPVSDKSDLKVTVAKWLTPDGTWINETGIEPDIIAELPSYAQLTLIDISQSYQLGDESEDVKNIEQILAALGYLEGNAVDSSFDELTQSAVEQVQSENNLEVSGVIGQDTALMMIQLIQEKIVNNDTQLEKALEVVQNQ